VSKSEVSFIILLIYNICPSLNSSIEIRISRICCIVISFECVREDGGPTVAEICHVPGLELYCAHQLQF
jgi:hypothetical protein